MSIVAADLLARLAANMPNDDVSTTGGAINTAFIAAMDHFTAAALVAVVSDGADTRQVTIRGRLASGIIASENVNLNGAAEVLSSNTYERVLAITLASGDASRTVLVKQGSGGTTRVTLPPNTTFARCFFDSAISDPSNPKVRYEKMFWLNNHGTLALLTALVKLTADPQAVITIALETSVNGTGTATDRLTAPGAVGSFVDDNVAIAVPGTDLAAGSKIGTWIKQSLATNNAAFKDSFTTQLSGGTT